MFLLPFGEQVPVSAGFDCNGDVGNKYWIRQRFYLLYNKWFTIHPQIVGELQDSAIWRIPWRHHRYIIDKCFNESEKAMFFVRKTFENGWSRNVLLNFMDTIPGHL